MASDHWFIMWLAWLALLLALGVSALLMRAIDDQFLYNRSEATSEIEEA